MNIDIGGQLSWVRMQLLISYLRVSKSLVGLCRTINPASDVWRCIVLNHFSIEVIFETNNRNLLCLTCLGDFDAQLYGAFPCYDLRDAIEARLLFPIPIWSIENKGFASFASLRLMSLMWLAMIRVQSAFIWNSWLGRVNKFLMERHYTSTCANDKVFLNTVCNLLVYW